MPCTNGPQRTGLKIRQTEVISGRFPITKIRARPMLSSWWRPIRNLPEMTSGVLISSFWQISWRCHYVVVVIGHPWKGGVCNIGKQRNKKCKYLNANTKTSVKTKYMFVSTLLCGSKMLNRAFITSTTSAELGFRNRKSTRDDLLLTDFGVRYAETHSCMA